MALGPKQMGEAIIRNLKSKTGKSLEEWIGILRNTNHIEKKEVVSYLKQAHGLGHFQAHKIYEVFKGIDQYRQPANLAAQLFDSKNSMGLYKSVESTILELGEDIRIQPCLTYIPFYRKNQFLLVSKAADNKLLLGLNLPNDYLSPRFTSCSKGSERINREIKIRDIRDIDPEVKNAIRIAYNNN